MNIVTTPGSDCQSCQFNLRQHGRSLSDDLAWEAANVDAALEEPVSEDTPPVAGSARAPALEYLWALVRDTFTVPSYSKSLTLDFPDFTIRQFELHSPSQPKSLVVHGHGRLRSPVHKIHDAPIALDFYTANGEYLEASVADLHKIQTRHGGTPPVESVEVNQESRDYQISHSPAFDNAFMGLLYHSQLFNRKPAIHSTDDLGHDNFHDVLIVKPGRSVNLSKVLKQVPRYDRVHCLFCRNR